jgi:hypothetical protein
MAQEESTKIVCTEAELRLILKEEVEAALLGFDAPGQSEREYLIGQVIGGVLLRLSRLWTR